MQIKSTTAPTSSNPLTFGNNWYSKAAADVYIAKEDNTATLHFTPNDSNAILRLFLL